jgi:hypothetical protein
MRHSYDYGFGLVDAESAVNLAIDWELKPTNEGKHVTSGMMTPRSTNTRYVSSITSEFMWSVSEDSHNANSIQELEHVTVYVDIDVPSKRRCLELVLEGPSGVESLLHSGEAVHSKETNLQWTFDTVRHWGESIYYRATEDKRAVIPSEREENVRKPRYPPSNSWFTNAEQHMKDPRDRMVDSGRWILRVKDLCYHEGDRNVDDEGEENHNRGVNQIGHMTMYHWKLDFFGE